MKLARRLFLAVMLIILYLPIFYLAFYSFNSGGTMSNFESFTLEYYLSVFTDSRLMVILMNTLAVALISSSVATLVGICGALSLYFLKHNQTRDALLNINNVMIVSPDVIIGASLLILFTTLGISLGSVSVILAHIAFSIPIVVLMILPKLYEMNVSYLDAARDLGATPLQTLLKVVLPQIKPGILAGFFMALTYSLDDFAVSFFVTGSGFSVLSVEIYSMARQGIALEINAISTMIFLLVLTIVLIYYFLSTRKVSYGKKISRGGTL